MTCRVKSVLSFAAIASLFALVPFAASAKDAKLYNYAVFPDGHWIGHGTLTVSHAGTAGSSTADGSFNFNLTVAKGVASGTMVEDYSGQLNHGSVVAKFDGISAGSGWTLSGSGGKVIINGSMVFTGQVTGNGHTFPINMTVPVTGGSFAPDRYSCSTASGDLALSSMKMFASSNTTISGPWTAFNVGGNSKIHNADADRWFATMDDVAKVTEKVEAGDHSMKAAAVKALIDKAQAVLAHIVSAEKCYAGGSHITGTGEASLAQFEADIHTLSQALKAGDFPS